MKKWVILCLCLWILGGEVFASAAGSEENCHENARTQPELNECGGKDLDKADTELNKVYKQILSENSHDPKFIEKLKKSQQAWLKFRDAEMEAIFPHRDEGNYYGTVLGMCYPLRKAFLTNQRTAQLRLWIEKTPEGDVCRGSQ